MDPAEWGDPIRKPRKQKRRDIVVSVRFKADEVDRLRAVAQGQALSTFVRETVLRSAEPPGVWAPGIPLTGTCTWTPTISVPRGETRPAQEGLQLIGISGTTNSSR